MTTLPTTEWGEPGGKRALLLHGINGSAAGWWRIGQELADWGWHVTAVDLRGHGTAERTDSYLIDDYVSDLPGEDWDLVIGHSLGGSIAVVAAGRPGFTNALVLLDPVLEIAPDDHEAIYLDQRSELAETLEGLAAQRPLWHPRDLEYKVQASRRADPAMVDGTFAQNRPWRIDAPLTVPTLVIAAGVGSMFTALEGATVVTIEGAGHSPHRDKPGETLRAIRDWLPA